MTLIKQITDWLRTFLETGVGILITSCFLLADVITFILLAVKKVNLHFKKILGLLSVAVILLLGLAMPILILVSSSWSGIALILLNLLAVFAIFSFLGLLYIVKVMNVFIFSSKLETEEATIRPRAAHSFFNGEIFVYMVAEDFGGRPLDHRISARIWSTNYNEEIIKEKGVGFSVIYKSNSNYTVRIIKTALNEATFQVIKKS